MRHDAYDLRPCMLSFYFDWFLAMARKAKQKTRKQNDVEKKVKNAKLQEKKVLLCCCFSDLVYIDNITLVTLIWYSHIVRMHDSIVGYITV